MNKEYVHAEIGEEVRFISGYYLIQEERRMKFNSREILVVTAHAVLDNSCCGRTGCCYALVPGYIISWKYRKNDEGMDITDVDPVRDEREQKEITRILQSEDIMQQVNFL